MRLAIDPFVFSSRLTQPLFTRLANLLQNTLFASAQTRPGRSVAAATPQRVGKMRLLAPDICAFGDSLTIVLRTRRSTYLPSVVVVTVLFSSGVRERFEGLIESEEEFSHHCGESQLVGFTFGAQTLVKAR